MLSADCARKTGAFSPENVRRSFWSSAEAEEGLWQGVWFDARAKLRQPSLVSLGLPCWTCALADARSTAKPGRLL